MRLKAAGVPAWLAGRPSANLYRSEETASPGELGLACTGLVLVPANLATSGVPYWASLPKVLKVFGSTFPKFHAHPVRSTRRNGLRAERPERVELRSRAGRCSPRPSRCRRGSPTPPTLVSNWICGYGRPRAWNGPAYSNEVGWFAGPVWPRVRLVRETVEVQVPVLVPVVETLVAAEDSVTSTPSIVTGRVPFGKHLPSANSHSSHRWWSHWSGRRRGRRPFGRSRSGRCPLRVARALSRLRPRPSIRPRRCRRFGSVDLAPGEGA